MDKRAKEIIGLPVVTFSRGTKISEIEDMILDPTRPQVLALLVQEKAWFHSAKVIPFGYISAIGPDAVIVPDEKVIVDLDKLKDKQLRALNNDQTIRGLRVLTDDGRKMGLVSDMIIDTKTGEIKGYDMSIGRVLDVTQGSRFIPAEKVINVGSRVVYISPQTADELEAQTGGWSGALDQAGGKLRTVGSKANTSLVGAGDQLKQSGGQWNEQLGRYGDQVRQQLPQKTGEMLIGQTAHRTVTAPDSTVIVNPGDTITQDQIDAARDTGRLRQLMLAAGAGPTQEHMDNFRTQANDSWEQTRTEFRELWNRLTGGYTQNVDSTDEKFMQQRIKDALGRPVNRVILNNDDQIILNTGDIITNHAVEEARAAGVLDVLVSSVYKQPPELSLSDLKAPHSGEASLQYLESGSSTREAIRPSSARHSKASSTETANTGNSQTAGTTVETPPAETP